MQPVSLTQPLRRKSGSGGFSCGRIVFILLVVGGCLVFAGALLALYQLPRMAASDFGAAGANLNPLQKVIYSVRIMQNRDALLNPLNPQEAPRSFEVSKNETVDSIAIRLEDEHFIVSADALRTYLIYAGLDTGIQTGKYQLSGAMTTVQVAHALQDATPQEVEFNILPGWRVEEVAAALPTSGIAVSPADFLDMVHHPVTAVLPDALPEEMQSVPSLEGFLMPGSYMIKRDIQAQGLVKLFYDRFNQQVTPDIRQGFAAQGLNLYEGVTLASIVQREAVVEDEQPKIASVFYNRLAQDNKLLQSDPTVQYAIGYVTAVKLWWKVPLTDTDLGVNSDYNTYKYPGLPPGPISAPGLPALRAVAFPARTSFLYFRALCDGSGRHAFANTYDEHVKNACP